MWSGSSTLTSNLWWFGVSYNDTVGTTFRVFFITFLTESSILIISLLCSDIESLLWSISKWSVIFDRLSILEVSWCKIFKLWLYSLLCSKSYSDFIGLPVLELSWDILLSKVWKAFNWSFSATRILFVSSKLLIYCFKNTKSYYKSEFFVFKCSFKFWILQFSFNNDSKFSYCLISLI